MIGEKFGYLTVIKLFSKDKRGHKRWLCKCVCGKTKDIQQSNLRSGSSKSCGCMKGQLIKNSIKVHNMTRTPTTLLGQI